MSNSFVFPPPPPPPPKRDSASATDVRGGFRGRGSSRGTVSRGSFHRGSSQGYRGRGSYVSPQPRRDQYNSNQSSSTNAPKRDYSTAFTPQPQTRPRAPPAVPSFDVDIKTLLPQKVVPVAAPAPPPKRKNNILGLTPSNEDASASEDDVDDESRLAVQAVTDGLEFQHKGKQLSLRTPAEIAAWIAERKGRFPTQAKADIAKKEAEERKKQWEERKRVRDEEFKAKREVRQKERNERERQKLREKLIAVQVAKAKSAVAESKEDLALRARHKAEKLKKRAEKAAKELQRMEEELQHMEDGRSDMTNKEVTDVVHAAEIGADGVASTDSQADDTSSSGSSASEDDSDSGSEPEEATSKRVAPDRVLPVKQGRERVSSEGASLCKNMMKYGRCKYRKNCRFSHNVPREKDVKPGVKTGRRAGLFQVMVEKEREEELQQALKVIITLGRQGVFDAPPAESAAQSEVPVHDS